MLKHRSRTTLAYGLIAAAAIAFSGAACRQHGTMSPQASNYKVPKDTSDAAARRRLMPGIRAGMTPDARNVEETLGY